MLSTQIIQTCIDDLKNITKVELAIIDSAGLLIASTGNKKDFPLDAIDRFVASEAESQTIGEHHYLKVFHEGEVTYIVVCKDTSEDLMIARIAVSQLGNLLVAYRERIDKNNFFQNLLLDNLLLIDIYNRAKKLHLEITGKRAVILIEAKKEKDNGTMEMLKNLFSPQSGDFVTAVDEQNLIVIKQLEEDEGYKDLEEISNTILGMMNTELMINAKIAYGTIVNELKDVSKSYKEAKMALDVGKIFYAEKDVVAYNTLGIGRLIYQLPINLCQMFIEEIFGETIPEELDEETLNTIDMFLANSLNVSETARQLYVHRNTLLYRLEKLQKATNLDIRIFDDALTLKIALMVVNYMKYLQSLDY
ncbi:MAG: helix-turn-helix domain-containing protein [Lachnospiraceae bacterium]|nr:helix-turn-helix domain-containing protein [Lachnospiraceae bacterium]